MKTERVSYGSAVPELFNENHVTTHGGSTQFNT